VIVRNLVSKSQVYLRGHEFTVSCVCLSPDGKFVAAGEQAHIGFIANVKVWKLGEPEPLRVLALHKGSIAAVAFSHSSDHIVSVGGRDDRQVVIWRTSTGAPICSVQGHSDTIHACRFIGRSETSFLTSGVNHVKLWSLDEKNKLSSEPIGMGSLKRTFTTMSITPSDTTCYCGTQSGDIVEVDLKTRIQRRLGPSKTPFAVGITCSALIPNGDLLVGTGTGIIAKIALSSLRVIAQSQLPDESPVSSITLTPDGTFMFAGTLSGKIYFVNSDNLSAELRSSSLASRVNAIAFPHNLSDIFATGSLGYIKLWNAKSKTELLSIEIPKIECYCLDFSLDGKSIVSGWSDGKIRSFTPQTGKLLFAIEDAHSEGVTAVKVLTDCARIVSGGMRGDIRIWKLSRSHQELVVSLKEHKGRIWSLAIRSEDNGRAVSASADGSIIVWDIDKKIRLCCIFESTIFRSVAYSPDWSQIIAVGSDKRVSYYDVFDGERLRIIEMDANVVAVSSGGSHIAVAGKSGNVSLIDYDEGIVTDVGEGHSVPVTALAMAPNNQFIVTGDQEGALFFWSIGGCMNLN
jgi:WD40 repeat protein